MYQRWNNKLHGFVCRFLFLLLFVVCMPREGYCVYGVVQFDNTSDLTTFFTSASPIFTNLSDQGINNTGSVNVPLGTDDIWTYKLGYSVSGGAGDVYIITAYFKIKANSG